MIFTILLGISGSLQSRHQSWQWYSATLTGQSLINEQVMYKHMKWRRMEDPLGVTHLETYDWRRLGLVISHLRAWTFALVHAIQWQRHERKAHQRQGSLDMHGMHPHVYMRPWRLWCRHMRPWRRWCRHALRQGREKKKNEHACIHTFMLQFAFHPPFEQYTQAFTKMSRS